MRHISQIVASERYIAIELQEAISALGFSSRADVEVFVCRALPAPVPVGTGKARLRGGHG
jgi:hypothetical protein